MQYRQYLSELKEYRNALKQILAYIFIIVSEAATLCDVIAMSTRKRNNGVIILLPRSGNLVGGWVGKV